MPKLIDNVRGRAIEEARSELISRGYAALTIRGIAQKLGIGVGTIYNYFPSKEYLAAGVMLEDWQELMKDFEALHTGQPAETVIADLFSLVQTFTRRYDPAWREYEQHGGSRSMVRQYHGMLAEQFTGYIRQALPSGQQEREPRLARFLAEITIRFGSDVSMTYEVISDAVHKLLSEDGSAESADRRINYAQF